jgi:O-antigen ligase
MIPLDSEGELFVGEIILPLLTVVLLMFAPTKRLLRNQVLRHCLIALTITLAGYMLADAIHHTKPHDFLRGWARVIVLGTNFLGLGLLGLLDEAYLWWYSLGLGFGSGAIYLAMGTPVDQWKFSYALSASSVVLCLASFPSRFVSALIMAGYGVANVISFDSRETAGISLLVAVLLWARRGGRSKHALSVAKLATASVVAVLALGIVFAATQALYKHHRHRSDAGRWANVEAALASIESSPIIGHGSWAVDMRMEVAFRIAYYEFTGENLDPVSSYNSARRPHSQILAAWYEGGLPGLAFFLYFGCVLIKYTWYCTMERPYNYMTPLYLFVSLQSFWHLIMSPFGGSQRLVIAFTVAVLCRLCQERQNIIPVEVPARRKAA